MNYVQPGYVRTGYIQQDSDTQGPFRFDGYGRFVFVSTALARMDVAELYSRWIDWLGEIDAAGDNSYKWPLAMRYSGKDPIPGGFTGSTFFMTNGWRVRFNPNTTAVDGVLFSEDFDTAYWDLQRQPVYPVTVSAVVNQVTTTQNVVTGDIGDVSTKIDLISFILRNKTITDPDTGLMTVFGDDGVTPLLTAPIYEDVEATQTYRGQGVQRRERLE
jgi:hypothetical protein